MSFLTTECMAFPMQFVSLDFFIVRLTMLQKQKRSRTAASKKQETWDLIQALDYSFAEHLNLSLGLFKPLAELTEFSQPELRPLEAQNHLSTSFICMRFVCM